MLIHWIWLSTRTGMGDRTRMSVLEQFGARPMTFDALYKAAGLGVGELLAALTRLELGGHIVALAGRRYQRR